MNEIGNIVRLRQPDEIDDSLTNVLRSGARQLLVEAVELEAEAFPAAMKGLKLADGRDRLVWHGHGPARAIQTGIGAVEVSRVKIRDRGTVGEGDRIRFTSRRSCHCGRGGRLFDGISLSNVIAHAKYLLAYGIFSCYAEARAIHSRLASVFPANRQSVAASLCQPWS